MRSLFRNLSRETCQNQGIPKKKNGKIDLYYLIEKFFISFMASKNYCQSFLSFFVCNSFAVYCSFGELNRILNTILNVICM